MAESDGQVVFTVELDDIGFQAGMARMQAALVTLGNNVLSSFTIGERQLNAANASGRRWVNSFAAGVRESTAATAAVESVVTAAAAAAGSSGYSGGAGVGRSIVSGMAAGASGMGGTLSAALVRIIRSALAAARRAAGISSPSRLFRDEVGRYLALGVQSGFTDTMAASVLPAIGRSVTQSAAAGLQALDGTLLAAVRRTPETQLALPAASGVNTSALAAAAVLPPAGARAAGDGDGVTNVTQNITFEAAMQAPDEVARAIRRQAAHGLAGARA